MASHPVPDGYNKVCPYLICNNAQAVLDFIKKTFDVESRGTMHLPTGKIGHAEVKLGDSVIMLADGCEEMKQGSNAMIHVYVEDSDATYAKALAAGGTSVQEMKTFFYGDRSGGVKDSSGHTWWISSHIEDVSEEEMQRRMEAEMKDKPAS